jgi:hypothetical protein
MSRLWLATVSEESMTRSLIVPPLLTSFDFVYTLIGTQKGNTTSTLVTTGGILFEAEAKVTIDGRRFISLPHGNRIYEHDWGYKSNSMGKVGQRIRQYSVPLDKWAKTRKQTDTL